MNKMLLTISLLFLASIGLIWYSTKITPPSSQKKILLVNISDDYPPFAFIKDSKLVGFDVDLITEIAKRLNYDLELKTVPFASLLSNIQEGTVDLILSGITPTPQREKELLFSDPYITGDPLVIVSRSDNKLKSLDDLLDKRVVVNEGFSADFVISKVKGPEIVRLESIDEAILEVTSKRADAFITASQVLKPFFQIHDMHAFHIEAIPDSQEKYAIGVSKKQHKLLEKIQSTLAAIIEDGTLSFLKKKWEIND